MTLLVITELNFLEVELPAKGNVKGGVHLPPPPPSSWRLESRSFSSYGGDSSSTGNISGGIVTSHSSIVVSSSENVPEPSFSETSID